MSSSEPGVGDSMPISREMISHWPTQETSVPTFGKEPNFGKRTAAGASKSNTKTCRAQTVISTCRAFAQERQIFVLVALSRAYPSSTCMARILHKKKKHHELDGAEQNLLQMVVCMPYLLKQASPPDLFQHNPPNIGGTSARNLHK